MSYKEAADQLHYRERTGTHATKPFRSGANDHLVGEGGYEVSYQSPSAAALSAEAAALKNEKDEIVAKMQMVEVELVKIRSLFRTKSLSEAEKRPSLGKRARLVEEQTLNQRRLREIRERFREIGARLDHSGDRERMFISVASQVLPADVYRSIWEAVEGQIGYREQVKF
jgi:hypothetical protein